MLGVLFQVVQSVIALDVTGGDDMGLAYDGAWRSSLDSNGSCWTEGSSCTRVMVSGVLFCRFLW